MDYKPITFSDENIKKYWLGPQNLIVRLYAYLQRGFALVNEAKNYFLIVFGSIWTVKFIDIMGIKISSNWIIVAGILGIPILILIGRWYLYRASKSTEFIVTYHGTVTKYDNYNMQVEQIELLKQIKELLERREK